MLHSLNGTLMNPDSYVENNISIHATPRSGCATPVIGSATAERTSGCSEPRKITRFCVHNLAVGVVLW